MSKIRKFYEYNENDDDFDWEEEPEKKKSTYRGIRRYRREQIRRNIRLLRDIIPEQDGDRISAYVEGSTGFLNEVTGGYYIEQSPPAQEFFPLRGWMKKRIVENDMIPYRLGDLVEGIDYELI